MSIKLLRKQISKGEWEYVEIDIDDAESVKALEDHNSKINHKVYEEKKLFSQFSVEVIETQMGHEFADDSLDPLQRLIEEDEGNFYDERENAFLKALELVGQSKATLTKRQLTVFESVVNGKSRRTLAKELCLSHTYINKTYDIALKKLRKFFLAYPEFIAYFPKLSEL